jgi:arylsulfotransferase ASST
MAPATDCSASEATTPSLVELSVTSVSDGSTSTMVPAFSPDIYDYYVQCAVGANELTVSVRAPAGASTSLFTETPATPSGTLGPSGSAVPEQTVSLSVAEDQAVVASVTDGTRTTAYWVRCLPHDFPRMQWNEHGAGCTRTPGYYLLGNEQPIGPRGPAFAIVLDGHGVPVWYHRESTGVFDVDNVVGGAISFMAYPAGSTTFEIHALSPFGTSYVAATDNHELRPVGNGDYYVFSDQVENGVDLTGYPVQLDDGGVQLLGPNGSILPCDVLEVDPKGNLVWQWIGSDHFDAVEDSTYRQSGPPGLLGSAGTQVVDPFHCNSIDIDPENGNLLVSARNMDSVFYIDRSSGAVLWKMGGASYSKDDATYIPVDDPFYRQHDARLQPGWSTSCGGKGQISLFDDETSRSSPARAVVYDVNVGAGEAACKTPGASLTWRYSEPDAVNTQYMGSFRILGDGSRIIGWGFGGELAGLVFTEVDEQGNDLLDFLFPDSASYRALKVPLSSFSVGVLRSTAGQSP